MVVWSDWYCRYDYERCGAIVLDNLFLLGGPAMHERFCNPQKHEEAEAAKNPTCHAHLIKIARGAARAQADMQRQRTNLLGHPQHKAIHVL